MSVVRRLGRIPAWGYRVFDAVTAQALRRLYQALGPRYPTLYLAIEAHLTVAIAVMGMLFLRLYVEMTPRELAQLVIGAALAAWLVVPISVWRGHRLLEPVRAWIVRDRRKETTVAAWRAAVSLPLDVWPRVWYRHPLIAVVLIAFNATVTLDLALPQTLLLFGAAWLIVGYGVILESFTLEFGMRPVVADIARHLPASMDFGSAAVSLRLKLFATLPFINVISALAAAGLTSPENDLAELGADVMAAVAVAGTVALVLTAAVMDSLLRPMQDLVIAASRVQRGDLTAQVPVTTADEAGAVALAFNRMVEGLAERERIREAFGTYLDPDVAELVLQRGAALAGETVEVTVMFLDVRDFTGFAERSTPTQVVATLNRLWEVAVPAVHGHGGHVDKFVGDGLLAVFGAPRPQEDHADQALAAAVEIIKRVRERFDAELSLGIGLNTGQVIAGNVGGGGRLEFSVIGDAVNVASRVEAATRETGDILLVSEHTRERLSDGAIELVERPGVLLRGKREPVRVYAPAHKILPDGWIEEETSPKLF